MATLDTLRDRLSRGLRDEDQAVFDDNSLNDMLNQGLAALSRFHPREVVDATVTLSASVSSYTTSASFTKIYRIDRYSAAGTYQETLIEGTGGGPNSGWDWHSNVLWLPPNRTWTTGDTLKCFGYAGYQALTADDDEPPLDLAGEWALIVYGQMEGYGRLTEGRASFQQWQANPGNRDTSALSLAQIYSGAQRRWEEEKQALRQIRKSG